MTRPIQQSVTLSAVPREPFDTFLDSKKHTALTGAPAKIGKKAGAAFTAFGGRLYWVPWRRRLASGEVR